MQRSSRNMCVLYATRSSSENKDGIVTFGLSSHIPSIAPSEIVLGEAIVTIFWKNTYAQNMPTSNLRFSRHTKYITRTRSWSWSSLVSYPLSRPQSSRSFWSNAGPTHWRRLAYGRIGGAANRRSLIIRGLGCDLFPFLFPPYSYTYSTSTTVRYRISLGAVCPLSLARTWFWVGNPVLAYPVSRPEYYPSSYNKG